MFPVMVRYYLTLASCGMVGTGTYLSEKCCHSVQKQIIHKQCPAEVCRYILSLIEFILKIFAIQLPCLGKMFYVRPSCYLPFAECSMVLMLEIWPQFTLTKNLQPVLCRSLLIHFALQK